jgi:hypothetical protein
MIIEEEPAIDARKIEHNERQRVVVFTHMAKQSHVGGAAIALGSTAIYAIGIVVRTASGIAIMLRSIHEDAILTVAIGHVASKQR